MIYYKNINFNDATIKKRVKKILINDNGILKKLKPYMDDKGTLQQFFEHRYYIDFISYGGPGGTPRSSVFQKGDIVTLTAPEDNSWTFLGWEEEGTGRTFNKNDIYTITKSARLLAFYSFTGYVLDTFTNNVIENNILITTTTGHDIDMVHNDTCPLPYGVDVSFYQDTIPGIGNFGSLKLDFNYFNEIFSNYPHLEIKKLYITLWICWGENFDISNARKYEVIKDEQIDPAIIHINESLGINSYRIKVKTENDFKISRTYKIFEGTVEVLPVAPYIVEEIGSFLDIKVKSSFNCNFNNSYVNVLWLHDTDYKFQESFNYNNADNTSLNFEHSWSYDPIPRRPVIKLVTSSILSETTVKGDNKTTNFQHSWTYTDPDNVI